MRKARIRPVDPITQIDREKIAKILTEKGATEACYRCKGTNFIVLEGYSYLPIQIDLDDDFPVRTSDDVRHHLRRRLVGKLPQGEGCERQVPGT